VPRKIHAIISNTEAMQNRSIPFQLTKLLQVRVKHLLRKPTKFSKDIEL